MDEQLSPIEALSAEEFLASRIRYLKNNAVSPEQVITEVKYYPGVAELLKKNSRLIEEYLAGGNEEALRKLLSRELEIALKSLAVTPQLKAEKPSQSAPPNEIAVRAAYLAKGGRVARGQTSKFAAVKQGFIHKLVQNWITQLGLSAAEAEEARVVLENAAKAAFDDVVHKTDPSSLPVVLVQHLEQAITKLRSAPVPPAVTALVESTRQLVEAQAALREELARTINVKRALQLSIERPEVFRPDVVVALASEGVDVERASRLADVAAVLTSTIASSGPAGKLIDLTRSGNFFQSYTGNPLAKVADDVMGTMFTREQREQIIEHVLARTWEDAIKDPVLFDRLVARGIDMLPIERALRSQGQQAFGGKGAASSVGGGLSNFVGDAFYTVFGGPKETIVNFIELATLNASLPKENKLFDLNFFTIRLTWQHLYVATTYQTGSYAPASGSAEPGFFFFLGENNNWFLTFGVQKLFGAAGESSAAAVGSGAARTATGLAIGAAASEGAKKLTWGTALSAGLAGLLRLPLRLINPVVGLISLGLPFVWKGVKKITDSLFAGRFGTGLAGAVSRGLESFAVAMGLPRAPGDPNAIWYILAALVFGVIFILPFAANPLPMFEAARTNLLVSEAGGEDVAQFQGSQYIQVAKTASPNAFPDNNPGVVTYSVTIKATERTLTNISLADVFAVFGGTGNPTVTPPSAPSAPTTLAPGEEFTFTFTVTLGSQFKDSVITNTITVTADAEDIKGETKSASATVSVGKPPTECFVQGEPGVTDGCGSGVASGDWPASDWNTILAAIAQLSRSRPYISLLCPEDSPPVKVYRTHTTYGGGCYTHRAPPDSPGIFIYNGGVSGLGTAVYTFAHESGHLLNRRTGLYSDFISQGVPAREGYLPTYPNDKSDGEDFAETMGMYVGHNFYYPNKWSTYPKYPNSFPVHYDFAKNVFGDVEY